MSRGLFASSRKTCSMPDVTRDMADEYYRTKQQQQQQNTEKDHTVQVLGLETLDTSYTTASQSEHTGGKQPPGQQRRRYSSGGVANCMDLDYAANPEERQRKGQCPSCGQQLYLVTTGRRWCFFVKQNARKKALTVPGLVNRGQCLKCAHSSNGTKRSSSTTSNSTSASQKGSALGTEQAPPLTATCVAASAATPAANMNNSDANSFAATTQTSQGSVSSTTALYEGPHNARGERHGKGTMRWANGDVYVGEFYQGSRQGTGTLNFADGSEYVGDWWNNFMHGSGTRRFVNGDVYVGDYRYSRREGSGRFYFSNGDLYYGSWKDDRMEGFGRYYYHSGQRFEGYFKEGRRNGKGKLQRTDGSLDLYRYEDDRRVGAGVRWSADRTKAWRLDMNRAGTVRTKKITVAEAVSLVYQIDGASPEGQGDGLAEEFGAMLTLEDTMDTEAAHSAA